MDVRGWVVVGRWTKMALERAADPFLYATRGEAGRLEMAQMGRARIM